MINNKTNSKKIRKEKKVKTPKVKAPKVKTPKEKTPKEKTVKSVKIMKDKKPKNGVHLSLKMQLIVGFLLPILMVVCIGIYAYNKAAAGMVNNYPETALQALQMTADYIDYGFSTVQSNVLELYNDGDVKDYCRNLYRTNPQQGNIVWSDIVTKLTTKRLSNDFIENIHIIPVAELNCMTSANMETMLKKEGFYTELAEEQEAVIKSKNR